MAISRAYFSLFQISFFVHRTFEIRPKVGILPSQITCKSDYNDPPTPPRSDRFFRCATKEPDHQVRRDWRPIGRWGEKAWEWLCSLTSLDMKKDPSRAERCSQWMKVQVRRGAEERYLQHSVPIYSSWSDSGLLAFDMRGAPETSEQKEAQSSYISISWLRHLLKLYGDNPKYQCL